MTRQNKIHKELCRWEEEHKIWVRDIHNRWPRKNRKGKNRKYWRMLDRLFVRKWRKNSKPEGEEE